MAGSSSSRERSIARVLDVVKAPGQIAAWKLCPTSRAARDRHGDRIISPEQDRTKKKGLETTDNRGAARHI
jgi:hypothetical protein